MEKKFSIIYLCILAFLMSLSTGIVVPPISGINLEFPVFGIIFAVSFVMTIVLGLILPLPKIDAMFCKYIHQSPESGLGKVLTNMLNTTIFMIFITLAMVAILTGVGEVGGANYISRCITGLLNVWPIVVVVVISFDPFATALAMKLAGISLEKEEEYKNTPASEQVQ